MLIDAQPVACRNINDRRFSVDLGHKIAGQVTKKNINFPCRVSLLDRQTDRVFVQVVSDAQGFYVFSNLAASYEYTLLAHDRERQFNAVVQDNLRPQ